MRYLFISQVILLKIIPNSLYFSTSSVQNIWLNSELVKNRVDTKPLMAKQALPVNSMSVFGSSILVAGDSEAIFVIPDVGL